MNVPDDWRRLTPDALLDALVELGMDAEVAKEYVTDDPNALPREWRQKLNKFIQDNE